MHFKIKAALIGSLVAVLSMGTNAFASSFADVHGFSTKGIAMGNAMTAIVNDYSSVYYNISGLGKTLNKKSLAGGGKALDMGLKKKGAAAPEDTKSYINELYLGFMYTIPVFKVDYVKSGDFNIKAADDLDYGILQLGLAIDINLIYKLPSVISSARIGLGMGAPADGSVTKVNDISPDTHNFMRYGREAQMAKIMVGFGMGFLKDMFGFGLGVNASFVGEGAVVMNGVQIGAAPQTPDSESRMDLSLSPSILAGLYFDFGKVLPVLHGLDIGASYRMETAMKIDPFNAAADVPNVMTMAMQLAIFDYYAPHVITTGVAYTRWGVTLSVDIDVALWKFYKVSTAVETNYGSQLPDLKNIVIPKIGVAYEVLDWITVMGGYMYQPSMVPDGANSQDVDFLDNDKHILSLGASFQFPKLFGFGGPIEATIAYQFQFLPEREVTKVDPQETEPNYAYGGTCHGISVGVMLKL